ncbi:MAG: Holliday junction DNA helicase RuvB C-terminal domain-containing protein, partial [Candidatus Paceibacterota bacterium]
GTYRLEFYTEEEIKTIIKRSAELLGIEIDEEGSTEIARRSRFTPRLANHLLKRCRDYGQISKKTLTAKTVKEALAMQGIDELGLSESDRKLLEVIITKFNGGPVGLGTVATALSEEEETVEDVNEPYLIQLGFLERTPRGRIATPRAYLHLGFDAPKDHQEKLI